MPSSQYPSNKPSSSLAVYIAIMETTAKMKEVSNCLKVLREGQFNPITKETSVLRLGGQGAI